MLPGPFWEFFTSLKGVFQLKPHSLLSLQGPFLRRHLFFERQWNNTTRALFWEGLTSLKGITASFGLCIHFFIQSYPNLCLERDRQFKITSSSGYNQVKFFWYSKSLRHKIRSSKKKAQHCLRVHWINSWRLYKKKWDTVTIYC